MAAEAARALNRLGRGHRSWDSLGGDPSSGQCVGRLTATFAVACVGAQRSQSTSLCRLGVETRGGRCGLAWSGASDTVPRPLSNPSSPLTIHRFRDPRAGDLRSGIGPCGGRLPRYLARSSWSRQPTSGVQSNAARALARYRFAGVHNAVPRLSSPHEYAREGTGGKWVVELPNRRSEALLRMLTARRRQAVFI
jgi:hypothetical protein